MGFGVMGCSWMTGKGGEMAVKWVMVGAPFFTNQDAETERFGESCMGGWAPCGIWACIYGGDGSCRTSRGKCQGIFSYGNWEIAVGCEVGHVFMVAACGELRLGSEVPAFAGTTCFGPRKPREILTPTITLAHDGGGNDRKALVRKLGATLFQDWGQTYERLRWPYCRLRKT